MPHFRLITECDRRAAIRYAASPDCPPEKAERIRALVKEARAAAKEGRGGLCIVLAGCLNEGDPTPAEITEQAEEIRAGWPAETADPVGWSGE